MSFRSSAQDGDFDPLARMECPLYIPQPHQPGIAGGPLRVLCRERSRSTRLRGNILEMKEGPSGLAISRSQTTASGTDGYCGTNPQYAFGRERSGAYWGRY